MYGIELAKKYYDYSIELQKDKNNVYFILGESPDVLPDLVKDLTSPSTFWLDAHASGENIPGGKYGRCPLVQELEAIAQSPCKEHVLMIDDIRLCDTPEWDHIKLTDIIEAIYKINPNYKIVYADGEEDGTFPNDILIATTHI